MKNHRHIYVLVPLVLALAWAAIYVPWVRRYHPQPAISLGRLPPAIFVPPQMKPEALPPDVVAMRRNFDDSMAKFISLSLENGGLQTPPPDEAFDSTGRSTHWVPNQSTDPALSSGTPAAEQPARHP